MFENERPEDQKKPTTERRTSVPRDKAPEPRDGEKVETYRFRDWAQI